MRSSTCDRSSRGSSGRYYFHATILLLLVSMTMTLVVDASTPVNTESRIHERHDVPPSRLEVPFFYAAATDTTTTATSSSELLVSPWCQPESDGYFGGTYGDPAILEYAVQINMDVQPQVTEDVFLPTIRQSIMEAVVQDTFPDLCRPQRRKQQRQLQVPASSSSNDGKTITGFWFANDLAIDPTGTSKL